MSILFELDRNSILKIKMLILYLNLLLISMQATIIHNGSYYFNGKTNYFSMDIKSTNLVAADTKGNLILWKIFGPSNYALSVMTSPFGINLSTKIRTNIWNTNFGAAGNFIVFNTSLIYQYNLSSSSYRPIYAQTTDVTIINSCYGGSLSELFILVLSSSISLYQVHYILNGVLYQTNLTVSATSLNSKMIYQNNVLYISFQTGIVILSGDVSLTSLKTINFTSTLVNYVDMTVDALSFGYSYNNTVYILSTADFSVLWQTTLSQMITGVKIISCYLFVYANPYIYQIDLELGSIVFTLTYSLPGLYLIDYIQNSNIYVYQRENKTDWGLLDYTTEYVTNTSACLTNYTYFPLNSSCVRSCSASFIVNNPNLSNPPSNTTNITNATTNNLTNYTNTTNNNTNTNATTVTIPNITNVTNTSTNNNQNYYNNISSTTLAYIEIFDKIDAIGFASTFGKSMVFTSFKIAPNFLLALTVFLDDLWFYRYHRKVYPTPAQWFMKEVDIINSIKIAPWFLDFLNAVNTNYVCVEQNQQRYQYLNFSNNDPEDVYFLYSSEEIYQGSLLLNVLFLSALKILSFIANKIQKQYNENKIIKSITNGLKYNTRPWVLLIALIESNAIHLAFICFLQLISNGFLSIQDKFNLLAAFFFLFVLLLYTFCFYPLIFTWEPKKCSSILLIKCKYKLGGFYVQSLNLVCRNVIRGFLNSFLISNYPLQISLLTSVDLIFAFISIKTFKYYKYKIIGALCVFYYVTFFIFDLYFAINQNFPSSIISSWDSQRVSLIILITLACTTLLISVSLLVISIFSFIKFIIKKYIKKAQDINSGELKKEQKKVEENQKKQKSEKKMNKKSVVNKKMMSEKQQRQGPSDPKNKSKIRKQKKIKNLLKIENCPPTPQIQYTHFKVLVKIKDKK